VNESEWLTGSDPLAMLDQLGDVSERKLRLFACACVRRRWELIPFPRQRGTVELAERLAEGGAPDAELAEARERAEMWPYDAPEFQRTTYQAAARTLAESANEAAREVCDLLRQQAVADALIEAIPGENQGKLATEAQDGEGWALALLVREVFGNPFRPVTIEPAWLAWSDAAVLAIAREIDDAKRFDELPYLADALTDAGCDDAALLRHLRDGGHVRGCWALDAILGRQ
jgi:hypothetical protein